MSLSNKQEILLQRYYDKECGFYGRFLARRLLGKNSEATQYINSLKSCSEVLQTEIHNIENEFTSNMWNRILARIEQEASSLDCARHLEKGRRVRFNNLWWSVSGAGVAVACGVVSFMLVRNPNNYTNSNSFSDSSIAKNSVVSSETQSSVPVVNVASNKNNNYQKPIILADEGSLNLPVQMANTTGHSRYNSRMSLEQRRKLRTAPILLRRRARLSRQAMSADLQ